MNYEKYVALAYMNPQGTRLSASVEEGWVDWLALVERAPWLRTFRNSPKLRGASRARTPGGSIVAGWPRFKHHAIADALFVSAVWGFGFERKHETDVYWRQELTRLQGSTVPLAGSMDVMNRLDPLPIPFRELDTWLEHYCL